MSFWPKKKKRSSQASAQKPSTPQPSASSATSSQAKSGSSHVEESSKRTTSAASAYSPQNAVPIRNRFSEPPKPSKPRCVRISMLPGDVTEKELENWLLTLEPSQTMGKLQSSSSISEIENQTKRLIQFHLARNGKNKQATATFTNTPAIFDRVEKDIAIEDVGKPWDGAVADFHFEGITIAYAPPDGTNIQADIVALSGLGGHALGSWRTPTSWQIWLRDFLPIDMKDVRVLLYGYDTSIISNTDNIWKEQFHSLAINMLDSLTHVRDEKAKGRPIIFLGHSLGGLVVEEALIIAFDNKNHQGLQNISCSSAGALLFGVPHEGIRYWELIKAVAGQRNEEFVRNLLTDKDTESSALLATQQRHFGRILGANKGLPVVCYWEKYETKLPKEFQSPGQSPGQEISRLLVTQRSAMGVGITLRPLEALGINGDHRTIVKFKTRNDEGYKSVLHNIDRIIQQHEPTVNMDASMQISLDTLAFLEMNYREQEIRDAHTHSCTWILEHDSYTKWINDDSGILGIRGKPGSGKSTLMKKIFQLSNLDKGKDYIQLAFFYHRRGTPMQHSQIGMYRTLLYQLLSQVPFAGTQFWKLVEDKRKWQGSAEKDWEWRLEELRQAFSEALLTASNSRKVRIFTDALDEAGDEAAQEVILYFREMNKKLLQLGARVSICFSCRHFPVIIVKEGSEVYVENHNQEDISMYIHSKLRTMLDFEDRTKEEEEEALESLGFSILEKSSNIFLWVTIVVLLISKQWNNGESFEDIRQTLRAVPSDLEETYRHILTKVVNHSTISKTLHLMQWIYLAERPLSVTEMRFALASDDQSLIPGRHSCKQSKEFVESDARMKRLINSLSGGLVEVKTHFEKNHGQDNTVQFIHQSINDFLIKDQFECLQQDISKNIIGQGHDRLAKSCINYLKLDLSRWKRMTKSELEALPFSDYSVKFCIAHAAKAEKFHVSQIDLLTQIEWPSYDILKSWIDAYCTLTRYTSDPRCPIPGSTLLHIASSWNISSVVTELLQRGVNVEEADQEGNVALHYSARWGSEPVMKILLAAHASPGPRNQADESPLSKAAGAGHESIIRVLLNLGEDINAPTGKSGNALQVAAKAGQASVVRLLLVMKADVNAQGGEYGNALQTAAAEYEGSEAVVELLLNAGADVNAHGGEYSNALYAAVDRGSEAVVQLLLNAGADANSQVGYYGNALQAAAAAYQGSEVKAQLLLDAGANVNAQGGYYGNALQAAAHEGSESVVEMLLNAGADVNAEGGEYGTALNAAVDRDSEAVIQLLLNAGADVDAQGVHNCSALYTAVDTGLEAVVHLLLDAGADVNAHGGQYGNALQAAVKKGSEAIVQLLLNSGVDVNAKGGKYGNALYTAVYQRSDTITQLLLDAGADVNAKCGNYGNALQAAVYCGSETTAQILLDAGADVNAQGGKYGNALQATVAKLYVSEATVKMLLNAGADVNAQGGEYGNAFQAAVYCGLDAAVHILLDAGTDVNAQGGKYGNALQAAAATPYYGSEEIVKLIIDAGADVNAQGGEYGNALQAAVDNGSGEIVKLIMDAGADVNAQGGEYGNALQAAVNKGSGEIVRLIMDAGADVNAQGGKYGNALQAAVRKGSGEIAQMLLNAGADVNAQWGYYGTALQAAAGTPTPNSEAVVQLILDAGADVNAQGGYYGNALQTAAYCGSQKTMQMLLDAGADVNAQGGKHGNALQAAVNRSSYAAVKLLLNSGARKTNLTELDEDFLSPEYN